MLPEVFIKQTNLDSEGMPTMKTFFPPFFTREEDSVDKDCLPPIKPFFSYCDRDPEVLLILLSNTMHALQSFQSSKLSITPTAWAILRMVLGAKRCYTCFQQWGLLNFDVVKLLIFVPRKRNSSPLEESVKPEISCLYNLG